MAFDFQERPDSRMSSVDSYEFSYVASGTTDDFLVSTYARAASPAIVFTPYGTMYRNNVRVEPEGFALWGVRVTYGTQQQQSGSATFDFDTTGATVKIKAAKEHIHSYPSGEDDNPHKGAIEVDETGKVQGADIIIPALKLNYRFRHPMGIVTEDFARSLAAATGCTNADTWRGFQPGELLYIGSTGASGTETEAEVAYQFIASQNATGLQIGDITGIVKDGFHYLWVEFKDETDSDGRAASQPRRVHIERVYDPIPFAETFGWS